MLIMLGRAQIARLKAEPHAAVEEYDAARALRQMAPTT